MNANAHMIEPDGPQIETSEILGFLIKRFSEALASDSQRVPFLLQGLGLVGLGTDDELLSSYKGLLASSILPPVEIVRRSIEIFQLALESDPDNRSSQGLSDRSDEDHEPDEKLSKRIIMNALREGKLMMDQSDYRYVQVFVVLGWGGLQCYQDRLAEFERILQSFADEPEELVKRGGDILKDALFRPGTKIQLWISRDESH